MIKKFELSPEVEVKFGIHFHRIIALKSFGNVKKGDIGGLIEKERNLSQFPGNAWIYDNARVSENAKIFENAWVYDGARIYGNAQIYGGTEVYGQTRISKTPKNRG